MKSRILKPPEDKSFFLFGPRGTGKSTWLRQNFPQATYLDLLDDAVFNELQAHPDRLARHVGAARGSTVILDEVQKVPALLDAVHRLIEEKKTRFILTGSSSRKLKKHGTNLLAGRALLLQMFPLTVRELGNDFAIARALDHGTLPSLLTEASPQKYLDAYVRAYIKEEVFHESLVRNLAGFSRFLEAAAFSHAQPLVSSAVARDCHVERKVVEDYFSILEDLLIAYRLPVFSKKAKRELLVKDKFYFFDAGVFRTLRPKGPLDLPSELRGAALEGFITSEIRALNHYLDWGLGLFHWRTARKQEVDLVLYGESAFVAMEIKTSTELRQGALDGLKLFLQDYPQASALFLYAGDRVFRVDDIQVVPLERFLAEPETWLFQSKP